CTITQHNHNHINQQFNTFLNPNIILTNTITLKQFNLQQIKLLNIKKPQPNQHLNHQTPFQQTQLTYNHQQPIINQQPTLTNTPKQHFHLNLILNQQQISHHNTQIQLHQHHLQINQHQLQKKPILHHIHQQHLILKH
ncbi:hypothetical protein DF186_14095, partial [Enterococcus hirae]